ICLRQGKYDIPDEEKLTALAMRILQRKVARKWRKARHDLNLQDRLAKESNSRNSSPAGAVKAMEDADLIQHLMRYMNKTEKELVGLIREGHTITDAAKLLGLSPAYARVLLSRMRARLDTMFDLPAGFP